jgi:hypothetical protein
MNPIHEFLKEPEKEEMSMEKSFEATLKSPGTHKISSENGRKTGDSLQN